jgi:hypothetical protein
MLLAIEDVGWAAAACLCGALVAHIADLRARWNN